MIQKIRGALLTRSWVGLILAVPVFADSYSGSGVSGSYIREHAIPLGSGNYPKSVRRELSSAKVILVGEMHGTREAPAAVLKLLTLLSSAYLLGSSSASATSASGSTSILVGLEIFEDSQTSIDRFMASGDLSILKQDHFFTGSYQDGRRSEAMAGLLVELRQLKGVRVVCIDPVHFDDSQSRARAAAQPRDLGMAKNLLSAMAIYAPEVTLALTGNCHSKLNRDHACNPAAPMGADLLSLSPKLNLENVISIDLRFEKGTAWVITTSNPNAGPQAFGPKESPYSEAVNFESYFLKEPSVTADGYNATLFTRTIHASPPLVRNLGKPMAPLVAH